MAARAKEPLQIFAMVFLAGVLATLAFLLQGCGDVWDPGFYCAGSEIPTQKIVGGELSTDRRATMAVLINNRVGCSGVALDARNVLTAAHCIHEGIYTVSTGGEDRYQVGAITVHPAYTSFPLHDLAILHTLEDIPGPYVPWVYDAAAGDPDLRESCTHLTAQGFGANDDGIVGELRETLYEVGGVSLYTLTTAAVADGAGICGGDSGGPLYAFVDGVMFLAGITSTSLAYECDFIGQHVHMVNYWPWVQENKQQLTIPPAIR